MVKKRFNSVRASIDVIDRESRIVLRHFDYQPLVSGNYEAARSVAEFFVRERCSRFNFDVSFYEFIDNYHNSCWSLKF